MSLKPEPNSTFGVKMYKNRIDEGWRMILTPQIVAAIKDGVRWPGHQTHSVRGDQHYLWADEHIVATVTTSPDSVENGASVAISDPKYTESVMEAIIGPKGR